MTTVLEKKRKPSKQDTKATKKSLEVIGEESAYRRAVEHAKQELLANEARYSERKFEIVNKLADEMSKMKHIERQSICNRIVNELKGIVGKSWISEHLPPEYKVESQRKNAEKRKSGSTNGAKKEIQNLKPVTQTENTINWIPPTETGKGSIKKEHTAVCEDCNQEIREREFGQYQIKPENCIVKDVDKYSRELLIEYVKYLDTENDHFITKIELWDRKVGAVAKENEQLKKKVAELEQQLKEANTK